MAQNFSVTRNIELSTLFYLETELAISWSGVTLVKSFNKAYAKTVSLPIVSVMLGDITTDPKEVGTTEIVNTYAVELDIFATSDGMRLDLVDTILNLLKTGWTYYTYSNGAGEAPDKVQAGRVYITEFLDNSKAIISEFSQEAKDRYRHTIIVDVRQALI